MTQGRERDGKSRAPQHELRDIAQPIGGEVRRKVRARRPFRRKDPNPPQAPAIRKENEADDHDAEPEPNRPPILFQPELAQPRALPCRDVAAEIRFDLAHYSLLSMEL